MNSIRHAKINEAFTMEFFGNPSCGYLWKCEGDLLPFATVESAIAPETIGGKTLVKFYFKPDASGEYRICFKLIRPWEKQSDPISSYEEMVIVT